MPDEVEEALADLREQEPEEPTRAEVQHWYEVYEQLIAMTELMLERTRDYLAALHPPARRHVERINVRIMEEELAAFRERQRFWAALILDE